MKLIIMFLGLVVLGSLAYIIRTKKELKAISRQMEKNKGEYVNIHTNSLSNEIEQLTQNINFLYDENQRVNAAKKSMEEEIRHSIANMSHDLRTPLTSIMGYIQLLRDEKITPQEHDEYIAIVERRTKSLERLISSFYDLSRLEGNEYSFHLKSISLDKILYDNIALYYNDFTNKNIEPSIEIEENLPKIISDDNAVRRVFSNLVGNALKHGEGFIRIILKKEGKYLVTEFINLAPTLTEEVVGKIFERFFTADKSRNDKNTGLGLAITKRLVEKLGNEITAQLVEGKLIIKIIWKQ